MKLLTSVFLIFELCLLPLSAVGDDQNSSAVVTEQEDFKLDLSSVKNPFEPQLPKKPVVVEQPAKPQVEHPRELPPASVPARAPFEAPRVTNQLENQNKMNLSSLVVSGLIWNSDRPQAIINNQVVDVGDEISGFKIKAIKKTGIKVEYNGVTAMIETKR